MTLLKLRVFWGWEREIEEFHVFPSFNRFRAYTCFVVTVGKNSYYFIFHSRRSAFSGNKLLRATKFYRYANVCLTTARFWVWNSFIFQKNQSGNQRSFSISPSDHYLYRNVYECDFLDKFLRFLKLFQKPRANFRNYRPKKFERDRKSKYSW